MTSDYKFKVEKDKKYVFALYPNNSNTQPIGKSCEYDTEKECREALDRFREIVSRNDLKRFMKDGEEETKYKPYIEYQGERLFSRTIAYTVGRYECDEWARIIKDNIDAEVKE